MKQMDPETIRQSVRERYAAIANQTLGQGPSPCCGSMESEMGRLSKSDPVCGCGGSALKQLTTTLGYSEEEYSRVLDGANMGLV